MEYQILEVFGNSWFRFKQKNPFLANLGPAEKKNKLMGGSVFSRNPVSHYPPNQNQKGAEDAFCPLSAQTELSMFWPDK